MGNQKKSYRNSTASAAGAVNSGEDLHSAARSGDMKSVISILSSNPLAVNSRDKHSRTPLHLAAWSGQTQVVEYLCKQKADVGAAAMDDMSAIHFAAQKGHLEVVRALVSLGATVKACTRKGFTPLHYAAQGSHLDLAKYLVRKGVNFEVKTKAGKTPLDLATSDEIRTLLIESEKTCKKDGDMVVDEKAEESDHKAEESDRKLDLQEKEENIEIGVATVQDEDKNEVQTKRKSDEDDTKDSSPEPKKARVALNHLSNADDGQEEDEDV